MRHARKPRKKIKTATKRRVKPPLLSYFQGRVGKARSLQMSKIRARHTRPELVLRKAIHAAGGRFRVHAGDLPGRPDIVNRRAKVVVFVDGCFWHGCPRHFTVPRTRAAFWKEKIRRNRLRRRQVRKQYDGWTVYEVFECQVDADASRHAAAILTAIDK